ALETEEVSGLETVEAAEEVEELPEGEEALEAEEQQAIADTGDDVTFPSEAALKGDFDILEPIEDDLTDLLSGIQSTSDSLPELKKLVQAGYSDTQDEDVTRGAGLASIQKPEESGVKGSDEEGAPLTIPDEVFKEKERVYHDDELSYLIDRIDEKELVMEEKDRLKGIFSNFIHHLGISTGALLLKNQDGTFSPMVSSGLSKDTVDRLIFKKSEKILKSLLKQGKTLYIRENPFFNGHMRSKFRPVDSSKIKGIIFSPVFISEKLKGIVAVCVTMGEILDSEIILKEIKKLKRVITRFI
ncbi:MAG: hypothetical protein KAJ15_03710, partial [Spirochaetes bacterium]|nr:hypothetical protein [Spirochaetota bacterium]